ncbi:MAG: YggT family protein [Candidatus Edwardsbacteria bacterium]|nr:YggT family protein [Candidatus Edwardsbacteria bacterium]MBU1576245.1 YggT family protein [Candidatus Edwardsbacteria bacterium]MBU2462586.1 YggT family protein [Candidatus Edwardsbacteria bacterium]MBU2594334.1 YggT family protein [Candidatus Edwardsbacteria bacterium]
MILLANFIIALGKALGLALDVYMWVIIIRALISWVNPDPFNPIVRLLVRLTDPVLRPIRRGIPLNIGLDLSPMLAILAIYFVRNFLIASLIEYGYRLKIY